tara:strand:- start:1061 stop:1594 length:534 start_codon:yes stop_codon:yes gene_type:complete
VSAPLVKSAQEIEGDTGLQSGLNILVAEDNLINQRLISALLQHCGHKVVVVDDGEQAVTAVREQAFDVVLMDIHMPNMDGLMATQMIRGMVGPVSTLPIVAVTANAMNADRAEYLSRGLTGFVAKPIDPDVLMGEIQAAIASHLPTETVLSGSDRPATGNAPDSDFAADGVRAIENG